MTALTIGRLSKAADVKVPTIRFYEQIGLMPTPDRTESDRRVYGEAAVHRLKFIRHARQLGFDIKDIQALLGLSDRPDTPCDEADRIALGHLTLIDDKIAQLNRLRDELARMVGCAAGTARNCRVIEVLSDHSLCATGRAAGPPNIIVILADDLGYGDLGCDGGTIIRTPNLDRMAAEGTRLSDFYASANLCTPSRAGLMTGRYAIRLGLADQVIQASETRGLPTSEWTLPKALKATHATALIGKWHLGHNGDHWPPTVHGFDVFKGLPYSHDMQPLAHYEKVGDGPLTERPADFPKLTQTFFHDAMAFAEAHRERPFFLLLALTAPHVPLVRNDDVAWDSPGGAYGDVVEEIDRNVGTLLERLKALGLDEDTLVVFTSDNGPWFEGSSGPFRDRKGGAGWDGGYRVPCILRQPGKVPAGQVSNAIASNLDF
eukprot:gene16070-15880_t